MAGLPAHNSIDTTKAVRRSACPAVRPGEGRVAGGKRDDLLKLFMDER
jgi:hypothetical protein